MSHSPLPVTVIISTKNEEQNILNCINSCHAFDEVIVVDSNSTDNTRTIVEKIGIKIINFTWNGKYPKKKQWILENVKIKNEWLFFLDADEQFSLDLVEEISHFLENSKNRYVAASIPIEYYFMHKLLNHGQKIRKVVFLKPDYCYYPTLNDLDATGMGELEGHYQPIINGRTAKFKKSIIHADEENLSSWLQRHINYAEWEALIENSFDLRKSLSKLKSVGPRLFLNSRYRSGFIFIYSYFIKFGFLDGRAGFDYAFSKAWYYWLSKAINREKNQILKTKK